MIAAIIVLGVTAVITSCAALWCAWDRAEREALLADLQLTIEDAEADRDRARQETARTRERADLAVGVLVEQRDAIQRMAFESDNLAEQLVRKDGHLLELMLGDRILPSLDDAADLAIPSWPIAPAPIFEALKVETAFPWVLLPGVTLADNDAETVACALEAVR